MDVSVTQSPLAGIDTGTILAGLLLIVLLSIVPLWVMAPCRAAKKDSYQDIIYKAYIIKKYIDKFDQPRLARAVEMLWGEYRGPRGAGSKG